MYAIALMLGKINMTIKITICVLTVSLCGMLAHNSVAQEPTRMTREEFARMDSLNKVYKSNDQRDQKSTDEKNISTLKKERRETKTKAKEARRIKKEADKAAKDSKNAYKLERRAQKARKQADAEAKKAEKSRDKSDEN
jgi:septal ring factor EnvC (AmiA/AmiB activator)